MLQKNKGGIAPIVLSEKQVYEVEALAACLTYEQIADYLGFSEDTFHEIKKRQPEVDCAYKRGKANAIDSITKSLIQKALDGDMKAAMFYRKTKGKWPTADLLSALNFSDEKAPY